MVERIMKAVKSSSKKRGRNITLGAVVGLLLSCTAVIRADENYLLVKKEGEEIKFSKNGATAGTDNPYEENTWDGTEYVNNIALNSTSSGYGLKLEGYLGSINFTNNGLITVTSSFGIENAGTIGDITNNGLITSETTVGGESYGIGIYSQTSSPSCKIGNIINNGLIKGGTYGIANYSGYRAPSNEIGSITNNGLIKGGTYGIGNGYTNSIGNITNNGLIKATGSDSNSYGIYNIGTMGNITNNSLIKAESTSSDSYGIYNSGTMGDITNTGIIYGSTNAVKNSGTIGSFNNYGLLISGSTNVVDGISIVAYSDAGGQNKINNYGLAFTADGSGSYKNHGASDANHNFGKTWGVTIDGAVYKIRNVQAAVNNSTGAITNIKSFKIENGELYSDTTKINDSNSTSNVILNGIENTLKVVGTGNNILTNSIINAYGTAVEFDNAGGKLTLSGTTINIKDDGTSYVIAGGSGDDTLTLKNGTTINGTIDGGTGNDTLNFGSAVTRAVANDGINIQHSISGFEKMNINTNVTLFEKTIATDGSVADLQVTGVTDVTIGANGVLTLRIDSANGNTHALSTGNTGTIKSENGGKLLLALNGAGLRETISFGNLTLDGSLVTGYEGEYQEDVTFETTSVLHSVKRTSGTNEVEIEAKKNLPSRASGSDELPYEKLNKIYQSLCSPLVNGLENFNVDDDDEKLSTFLGYLNDIYVGNPYSYSSELSRKSAGIFRDIVTDNQFKANTGKWMIYGGLTHVDGGTKDTYYGKGYYTYDIGSSDMDADTKITGAYMLGEYGVSNTLTSGVVIGGNKLKSDLSNGSKVDGSVLYLGAYAKKYIGNLKVTAGAGFQYGDYDADRIAVNRVASDSAEPVMKYSDNYNDITYDIYLNGRYSHSIGENLFLEPYGTLSYTYIDQDGANEGGKTLAIETDSKSFDYTVGKVGVDLKKVIPHERGKSTLSAGISYTKILDGADEEHITGRFKGGSDFDILVAHKNEHSIGLNAKYALELENGVILDIKGTYSVERDSHNNSGKNKTKGEWIVGAGIGYKF